MKETSHEKPPVHYMIPFIKILEKLSDKDRNQISSHLGLGVRARRFATKGQKKISGGNGNSLHN